MDLDSPEARRLNHPFFSSSTGFSSDIFADACAQRCVADGKRSAAFCADDDSVRFWWFGCPRPNARPIRTRAGFPNERG